MGLLRILPRLGKSGGHIPHSSPFSYSRRLPPLFFPPFIFTSEPRSFVAGEGAGMGPSQGNFWRSGRSRRPVRARRGASSELRALWNTGDSRSARTAARRGFRYQRVRVCPGVLFLRSVGNAAWRRGDVPRSSSARPDAADPIFFFYFFLFKARWI